MRRPAPTLGDIDGLAKRTLNELPRLFKQELGPVVIRVEELPDEATEAEMNLDSPFDLLGLYRGAPLPARSVSDPRPAIDFIFLYRQPILDYCGETGEDLPAVVRHVLIHEIGHHFGFSDDDMEQIERSS